MVFVGHGVARGSGFPIVDGTALAHWTAVVGGLGVVVAIVIGVVGPVANDGASQGADHCGRGSSVAFTNLATDETTGETADNRATIAALLLAWCLPLCGFIFGPAFLTRNVDLFELRVDTDHETARL